MDSSMEVVSFIVTAARPSRPRGSRNPRRRRGLGRPVPAAPRRAPPPTPPPSGPRRRAGRSAPRWPARGRRPRLAGERRSPRGRCPRHAASPSSARGSGACNCSRPDSKCCLRPTRSRWSTVVPLDAPAAALEERGAQQLGQPGQPPVVRRAAAAAPPHWGSNPRRRCVRSSHRSWPGERYSEAISGAGHPRRDARHG